MTELYLDGHRFDFEGSIAQTFQVNSLEDLETIQLSYTSTIKLPKTVNNIEKLERLGLVGIITRKPYNYLRADIIENGISCYFLEQRIPDASILQFASIVTNAKFLFLLLSIGAPPTHRKNQPYGALNKLFFPIQLISSSQTFRINSPKKKSILLVCGTTMITHFFKSEGKSPTTFQPMILK